jgi:hypothetical protein
MFDRKLLRHVPNTTDRIGAEIEVEKRFGTTWMHADVHQTLSGIVKAMEIDEAVNFLYAQHEVKNRRLVSWETVALGRLLDELGTHPTHFRRITPPPRWISDYPIPQRSRNKRKRTSPLNREVDVGLDEELRSFGSSSRRVKLSSQSLLRQRLTPSQSTFRRTLRAIAGTEENPNRGVAMNRKTGL